MIKIKNKKFILLGIGFLLIFCFVNVAFAQVNLNVNQIAQDAGLSNISMQKLIANIIKWVLALLGLVLLIIIMIAGFRWMTSGGDNSKIQKAKQMLVQAVIGFAIILASYVIVSLIMGSFALITNGGGGNTNPISDECSSEGCTGCLQSCSGGEFNNNDESCSSLCSDSEFRFRVTSYSPSGSNVNLCNLIQVKFNSTLNQSTVNSSTFHVSKCSDSSCNNLSPISGNIISSSNIAQFKPSSDYEVNTIYKVELLSGGVLGGIKDNADHSLYDGNFSWTFTTGSDLDRTPPTINSVFPPNGRDNVCTRSHISALFSKEMDEMSLLVTSSSQLYKNGVIDNSLTFNHSVTKNSENDSGLILRLKNGNYAVNSTYTPTLKANIIKDTCGNFLDGNGDGTSGDDYSWNFTTGQNADCKLKITNISSDSGYYDGPSIKVQGEYLMDANVKFSDNIVLDTSSKLCMANGSHWNDSNCKSGAWSEEEMNFYVPAGGGGSNGAKDGRITLIGQDVGSDSKPFNISSPRIDYISPASGPKGQFLTITGSNFGETISSSKVYFRSDKDSSLVETNLPCGENGWKDNYIVISAPDSLTSGTYYIQVEKKLTSIGESHWSNLEKFNIIDGDVGPGICSINKDTLHYNDQFTIFGVRLGDSTYSRGVVFGNNANPVTSTVVSWGRNTDETEDSSVTAITPNLANGRVGLRVFKTKNNVNQFSNSLPVSIASVVSNNFQIRYISPTSTTVGSYVTIYGSGFGNTIGGGKVLFGSVEGSFDFPTICSTNYWQDNKIVVKVPNLPSNISTNIKVIKNGNSTNEVSFFVKSGSPAPSICSVNPTKGKAKQEIIISGEYFTSNTKATFSYQDKNDEATPYNVSNNSLKVQVPDNTKTGLLALHDASNNYGNSWNFEYIGSNTTSSSPESSFYGWHFSTCVSCKIPRVRETRCSLDGHSSPSPYPGSDDFPPSSPIYIEFEYLDGSNANMSPSSLNGSKYVLTDCGNGNAPDCSSGNTIRLINISRLHFSVSLIPEAPQQLLPNHWYRVFLNKDNIENFDHNNLLEDYSFNFRVSQTDSCSANKLRIAPPDDVQEYYPDRRLPYEAQLWDSKKCYQCNDHNYSYLWGRTSNIIYPITSTTSTATIVINGGNVIGTVGITATNNNLSLSASTTLTVTGNCSNFNTERVESVRQSKCIDQTHAVHPNFNCCWDDFNKSCVNSGNAICDRPFVLLQQCKKSTFGQQPEFASPSPVSSSTDVVIDSIIHAEFAKSGTTSVSMNTGTYLSSGSISVENCGTGNSPVSCRPSAIGIGLASTANHSIVDYLHSTPFTQNTWYKITLGSSIKDIFGKSLQPKSWTFKTGSNVCSTTNINVLPSYSETSIGSQKAYSAICSDKNCNVCDSSKYHFIWNSSTSSVASVSYNTLFSNVATATALMKGFTNIYATNTDLNISNYARLKVITNCNSYSSETSCNQSGSCCWDKTISSSNKCTSNLSYCRSSCSSFSDETSCLAKNCCFTGGVCTFDGYPECRASNICQANTNIDDCKEDNCCWSNNLCVSDMNQCSSFYLDDHYPGGTRECPNTLISADFGSLINNQTIAKNIKIRDLFGNSVPFNYFSYFNNDSSSTLLININNLLATSTSYRVLLSDRIKSIYGNNLDCGYGTKIGVIKDKMCVYSTNTSCSKDSDCNSRSVCVNNYCINSCDPNSSECNAGSSSYEIKGKCVSEIINSNPINPTIRRYCVQGCEKDSDCDTGGKCNYISPEGDFADNYICSWRFGTGSSICELNHITIVDPENHYYKYTKPNYSKSFVVQGKTSSGATIVPIHYVYDWAYSWSSQDTSLIQKDSSINERNSGITSFISQNKNGNTQAIASVTKLNPAVGYNGQDLQDKANVELFMCNNPWSFEDKDYDFKLEYCMDGGLPSLSNPPIIHDYTKLTEDGLLREYIFTYPEKQFSLNPSINDVKNGDSIMKQIGIKGITDNRLGFNLILKMFSSITSQFFNKVLAQAGSYQDDVIGIRIYSNESHFSPSDWYYKSGVINFQGNPSPKPVDSYSGIIDGRTVYVNAANFASSDNKIYTNIYLISKNQNASPQTSDIFNQLLGHWSFNTNNLDRKTDLIKDVIRWQDLRSMEAKLDSYAQNNKYCAYKTNPLGTKPIVCPNSPRQYYPLGDECYSLSDVKCTSDEECQDNAMHYNKCLEAYPSLNSGTYVRGTTNSLWPSWNATLSATINSSLPIDPDNYLSDCTKACPKCNPQTCWDDINHSFYCMPGSKMYYYESGNKNTDLNFTTSYNLYTSFKYWDKSSWAGNNNSLKSYNSINLNNEDVCNNKQ